jgi:hypothetical protein
MMAVPPPEDLPAEPASALAHYLINYRRLKSEAGAELQALWVWTPMPSTGRLRFARYIGAPSVGGRRGNGAGAGFQWREGQGASLMIRVEGDPIEWDKVVTKKVTPVTKCVTSAPPVTET